MLKGLKGLFIYEKPSKSDFEFAEDPSESAAWNQYRNKEKNRTQQQNDQSVNADQRQAEVQNKLLQILKGSQEQQSTTEPKENEKSCNNSQEKEMDSAAGGQADENMEEPEKNGNKKDDTTDSGAETGESQKQNDEKQGNADPIEKKQKDGKNLKQDQQNQEKRLNKRPISPLPLERLIKNKAPAKQEEDDNQGQKAEKRSKIQPSQKEKDIQKDKKKDKGKKSNGKNSKESGSECKELIYVSPNIQENIEFLKFKYHLPQNKDIIIREFNIAQKIPAFVIFVDGMINSSIINEFLLPELMYVPSADDFNEECPLDYVEKNVISLNQIEHMNTYKEINQQILSGLTVLFIDGCGECLVIESRGFERRMVGPPTSETVVNGAHEGFTETLRTNITLIRRIIKNEDLLTEFHFVSKTNNFLCAMMYIEGIANPRIVEEVKRRIKNLDIDYISGSGMLEQLIEDKPSTLFPQVISTERPDRVGSFLMEGKVALICEGTPFALAMPSTFFDLYHTSEESNLRHHYGTFLRIVRIAGLLIAAFLPGMYTALILYHQEMIPTALLFSIIASRTTVPFPTILEIILMEFSFELIREGGIRVPGVIGNTIGIIGALIMGQAAVSAGLVSPALIIIVALSGLGSFAIPNYSLSLAVRIIRFLFIIFGFLAGFYGISAGFTILMAITLNMKSFGVPFFAPMSPVTRSNSDKILRANIQEQQNRPDYINPVNLKRMADNPRGWSNSSKGGKSSDE